MHREGETESDKEPTAEEVLRRAEHLHAWMNLASERVGELLEAAKGMHEAYREVEIAARRAAGPDGGAESQRGEDERPHDLTGWPERTVVAAAQGEINLAVPGTEPRVPMARVLIDLYSLERQATVRHLIPYGSELEPLFRRGPGEVEGWRKLVDALERVLNEVVEIKARQWWTSDDARFRAGERVRVLPHPNFPAEATGTVAASLPPRRVRPGVLYRVKFDEPQVNANVGSPQPEADILEEYLQPLAE